MSERMIFVYGTRPEAIKIGPVVAALKARGTAPEVLCTGQHTDLLRGTPAETDLADGVSLGLASGGDVQQWVAAAKEVLAAQVGGADLLVVQGDTMSAYAGACAAAAAQVPIVHIEAGVRSGCLTEPWPEERFRIDIDQMASLRLAPTTQALANLQSEGLDGIVTGNTVVSALARYGPPRNLPLEAAQPYALLTLHRRELLQSERLNWLLTNLAMTAEYRPNWLFLWPLHPHTARTMTPRAFPRNVYIIKPMEYAAFQLLLHNAALVLTDSGGLMEEACTLGVPCAILRNVNDRPEAVAVRNAKLYGTVPSAIGEAVRDVEQGWSAHPSNIYGEADAAERVAHELLAYA